MSLLGLLTQTITVTTMTEGAADAYGDTVLSAGTVTEYQARLEPRSQVGQNDEALNNRDTVVTRYNLFLPPDAVISSADLVTDSNGDVYAVTGEPSPMRTPRGVHHIEAVLTRIQG